MPENHVQTILYVDDEPSNLRIFEISFKRHYNVITTESAKDALDILKKEDVHMVITDQRMSGMSGLELLATITPLYPDIIKIILIGYSDVSDIIQALNLYGINRYMVKPWDYEELKSAIDQGLDAYRLKTENRRLLNKLKTINESLEDKVNQRTLELIKINERLVNEKDNAYKEKNTNERLISMISHEFRNPLNTIIGTVRLLRESISEKERQENLEILDYTSKSLMTLVNDILNMSKMESGSFKISLNPLNLHDLTLKVISTFKQIAAEKEIELIADIADGMQTPFLCDAARYSQVLNNLISNAVKFTHKGNVTISIAPEFTDEQYALITILVKDTGLGMDKEALEHIFDEYYQVSQSSQEGTGLGLAIVNKLVGLLGGFINVKSSVGEGSCFEVILKLEKAEISQHHIQEEINEYKNLLKDCENVVDKKILVVDDNTMNLALTSKFLERLGAKPFKATDGEIAVSLSEKNKYDLILMDINMPKMGGIDAIKLIQKGPNASTPIFGLTATVFEDESIALKELGIEQIILKPYEPNDLTTLLSSFFAEKESKVS